MPYYYDFIYVVFYNENPVEDGDSFLGAFIRKRDMEGYIKANFTKDNYWFLSVGKLESDHWFRIGEDDVYWKDWHKRTDKVQWIKIDYLFEKKQDQKR